MGQSSFRSSSNDGKPASVIPKRPSSLAASETDVFARVSVIEFVDPSACADPKSLLQSNEEPSTSGTREVRTVTEWKDSFERLLEDTAGLHAFAQFLKKEFSAENIYFWTACERYRKMEDANERSREANAIYARHLNVGAAEQVNVDSKGRAITPDDLNAADSELFLQVSFPVQGLKSTATKFPFRILGSKTDFQFDEIR